MRQRRARITEQENPASVSLDTKSTGEILRIINREDQKVAPAVAKTIPQITRAVDRIVEALRQGGRLIYLGAGTSGRLGVLDAAECIPTFGTDRVQAVLAGGPRAMFRPTESAEDTARQAAQDLRRIKFTERDVLVGISASGRTPYTLGGMAYARRRGGTTIGVTCDPRAPLVRLANIAIVPVVGPEVIAGSTRMKAGTAQKLALNMLSTAAMVRWGRVFSHWMINVRAKTRKLLRRAQLILRKTTGCTAAQAAKVLEAAGQDLPVAMLTLLKGVSPREARSLLRRGPSMAHVLRGALAEGKVAQP